MVVDDGGRAREGLIMKDATAGFSLARVGVSVTHIRETTDRVANEFWEGVRALGAARGRQLARRRLRHLVHSFREALDGQANWVGVAVATRLGMASQDEVEALRRRIVGLEQEIETLEEARRVEERPTADAQWGDTMWDAVPEELHPENFERALDVVAHMFAVR